MKDGFLAFAPDGSLFGPTGGQIGVIDGENVLAGGIIAAMMYGVGFKESRDGLIPLIGGNGNLVA